MRSVASMPSVPRFLMNGRWCGWKVGSSIRNSAVMRSPFGDTRLPSRIMKPASCRSWFALRSSARSAPDPSLTGGTKGSPNTSSATWPRNGSSKASSSALGLPIAFNGEFSNTE